MLAYITRAHLEELGVSYDSALPQDLYDDILRLTGHNPFGLIVSLYPPTGGGMTGLFPVTVEGAEILTRYYSERAITEHEMRKAEEAST